MKYIFNNSKNPTPLSASRSGDTGAVTWGWGVTGNKGAQTLEGHGCA